MMLEIFVVQDGFAGGFRDSDLTLTKIDLPRFANYIYCTFTFVDSSPGHPELFVFSPPRLFSLKIYSR